MIKLINCAKRSFHPCCTSNSVVRPSPSSSFVREIIDFCEGYQKAASLLLSTGGLHDWFWRIQKWTALKCFKEWYRPVQGPFFDTALEAFLQDVCKTMTLQIRPDTAPLGSFHRCGVILRRSSADAHCFRSETCDTVLWVRTKSVASRPCRARCI